jgi:hypothetical protein
LSRATVVRSSITTSSTPAISARSENASRSAPG